MQRYGIYTLYTTDKKQLLISTSAKALKLCTPNYHDKMSYMELHSINNWGTRDQICKYRHAPLLYKLINQEIPYTDFIDLNFQQKFNNRLNTFNFFSTNNNYKIGCNLICNRLAIISNKIEY